MTNLRRQLALDERQLVAIRRLLRERLAELVLPSVDEVIESFANRKRWTVASPALVGLRETVPSDPERLSAIEPDRYASLLAMGFAHDGPRDDTSLDVLIGRYPDRAARTAFRVLERPTAETDRRTMLELYLVNDPACLPLLTSGYEALLGLHRRAGRVFAMPLVSALLTLARRRLSAELFGLVLDELWDDPVPLSDEEAALYLIGGLIANREVTALRFAVWIGEEVHLDAFLDRLARLERGSWSGRDKEESADRMPAGVSLEELGGEGETLALLLETLVPRTSDDGKELKRDDDMPIMGEDHGRVVSSLIRHAADDPSPAVGERLDVLLEDPRCASWRHQLRRAQADHRTIMRLARYTHPTPEAIQQTLRGGAPTNVLDLQALGLDHLEGLNHEICGSDRNAWRPYWNEDRHGRPRSGPKSEESCRDAMLGELRARLRHQSVESEARYRGGTRADLKLTCRNVSGLAIPIEIKRAYHDALWTAPHKQLERRYLIDPDCRSHGIYVVLWFGPGRDFVKSHPVHGRATTPEALQEMLVAHVAETTASTSCIAVKVIDVSAKSVLLDPTDEDA